MRRVILGLGLAVGLVAWAIGIYGLVATPYDHGVPTPVPIISYGASAMMGTLLLFVIVFAHGTRAGDID